MNLLQDGDEEVGPADSLRVVTLVDRGLQEAQTLEREPATQAQLYETLGGLYQKLGNFPRADSLLKTSLAQRKKLFGPVHPDVAQSLIALGMLRDAEAEFDSAEAFIAQALTVMKQVQPHDEAGIRKATASLGRVLSDKGDYDRAIPILNEAVRLEEAQTRPTTDLSVVMSDLANTEFYAGNYARSDTLNRKVLEIDHRLYGSRHPHIADDLMNLGAINRYKTELAPDHQLMGIARVRLGETLLDEKRFADAKREFSEADRILSKQSSPPPLWVDRAKKGLASATVANNQLTVAGVIR